jgi:hypothetical protein
MERAVFEKPVIIQLGRIDRDRVVVGVRDAANFSSTSGRRTAPNDKRRCKPA